MKKEEFPLQFSEATPTISVQIIQAIYTLKCSSSIFKCGYCGNIFNLIEIHIPTCFMQYCTSLITQRFG